MAHFIRPVRLASVERLREAWRASKDASQRGRSAGVDGVTPYRFRSRLDENIRKVRGRLLRPGFKFNPLRPVFIPKAGGRIRIICVPTVEDRLIQRLLLRYLNDGDKLTVATPVSYGFRAGLGIQTAIKKARNLRRSHPWVLKSDITSFFDKIRREELKAEVAARLRKSSAVPLIAAAIETEIECSDDEERLTIERAGIETGLGLRQGMPLSPLLSNLVLRNFDLVLYERGIHLVRYADDFVVLADTENQCLDALSLVRELLAKKGHTVPELKTSGNSKTVIYPPDTAVELLGFELRPGHRSYEIAVPKVAFEEIRHRLKPFHEFDTVCRRWRRLSRAVSVLNSTVDGFINVYRPARNFADFQSHAMQCRQNAVGGLLSGIFGAEIVKSLDRTRRDFLDIAEPVDSDE